MPEASTRSHDRLAVVDDRISWFPVPDEEELDEQGREDFRQAREANGVVPQQVQVNAWRPERFRLWKAYSLALDVPTEGVSTALREAIAVVVSQINGCSTCLVTHGARLREAIGDALLADRIAYDYRRAGLEPRVVAVLDYAVKITKAPTDTSEADIEALRAHGYSDEDIWDIIEVAAKYAYTNRIALARGHRTDPAHHGRG